MRNNQFFTKDEAVAILSWHSSLNDNRGDRARLRRAERPEDVLLTSAFFSFQQRMPDLWQKQKPLFTSAAVAGLLSHVKTNQQQASRVFKSKDTGHTRFASFAEQLAAGDGKPVMSELRFQQLQKSRTTDDFYRHVIRAIRLLDGRVNIISLAGDIVHWHLEFDNQLDLKPGHRLAVRWASDYFAARS